MDATINGGRGSGIAQMSTFITIILGIVANVATIILLALYRKSLTAIPSRNFWKLNPVEGVIVAMSLPTTVPNEHTVYVPAGDMLAFNDIVSLLRRLYPDVDITTHDDPETPIPNWQKTVILIGGGRDNITTRFLLAALNPPMHGRTSEHPPDYDPKALRSRDGTIHRTPHIKDGILSKDYGYVIRTLNPFYPDKYVFVVVGGYTHGTHGAALWVTQATNLAWLRLNYG